MVTANVEDDSLQCALHEKHSTRITKAQPTPMVIDTKAMLVKQGPSNQEEPHIRTPLVENVQNLVPAQRSQHVAGFASRKPSTFGTYAKERKTLRASHMFLRMNPPSTAFRRSTKLYDSTKDLKVTAVVVAPGNDEKHDDPGKSIGTVISSYFDDHRPSNAQLLPKKSQKRSRCEQLEHTPDHISKKNVRAPLKKIQKHTEFNRRSAKLPQSRISWESGSTRRSQSYKTYRSRSEVVLIQNRNKEIIHPFKQRRMSHFLSSLKRRSSSVYKTRGRYQMHLKRKISGASKKTIRVAPSSIKARSSSKRNSSKVKTIFAEAPPEKSQSYQKLVQVGSTLLKAFNIKAHPCLLWCSGII